MGIFVKGCHQLVGVAVGSEKGSMSFSGKGIDDRSDMLVGDVRQVEGEVGRASNGEVGSDVATVLGK